MSLHIRILSGRLDRTAGSYAYGLALSRRLAQHGHHVSVMCFDALPELNEWCEVAKVRFWDYSQTRVLWRLGHLIQYRKCRRELARFEGPEPDIVVGTEHFLLAAHSRRFPRVPFLYFPHSLIAPLEIRSYSLPTTSSWVSERLFARLQRWALNGAHRTVRFTQRGCLALTDYYGNRVKPRFAVNRPPIDLPGVKNHSAGDVVRLAFVGRLVPSKNVGMLIRTLAGLRDLRWRFDVVGDGVERGELERMTSALGLSDRVVFHGFQEDPSPWYREADLFLFASRLESCGVVLLEAMSYGIPCLVIRADGRAYLNPFDEFIEDDRTGFIANDEQDFSKRLESLLQWPERLAETGQTARRYVAANHSWSNHLAKYEQLFEQALAGGV